MQDVKLDILKEIIDYLTEKEVGGLKAKYRPEPAMMDHGESEAPADGESLEDILSAAGGNGELEGLADEQPLPDSSDADDLDVLAKKKKEEDEEGV